MARRVRGGRGGAGRTSAKKNRVSSRTGASASPIRRLPPPPPSRFFFCIREESPAMKYSTAVSSSRRKSRKVSLCLERRGGGTGGGAAGAAASPSPPLLSAGGPIAEAKRGPPRSAWPARPPKPLPGDEWPVQRVIDRHARRPEKAGPWRSGAASGCLPTLCRRRRRRPNSALSRPAPFHFSPV